MEFNPNNPFLVDLLGVEDGAAAQKQPAQQLLHQPGAQRCKLPEFWLSNPVLWFAGAEFNFEVAGVVTEREYFMHTANALPYDALTLLQISSPSLLWWRCTCASRRGCSCPTG